MSVCVCFKSKPSCVFTSTQSFNIQNERLIEMCAMHTQYKPHRRNAVTYWRHFFFRFVRSLFFARAFREQKKRIISLSN